VKTAAETDKRRWERETLDPALAKGGERASSFTTISGRPIDRLYTPEEIRDIDPARDIGEPGAFPYTRGIHQSGYRGKLWTMRQFAGFGTPEETNARYKALLAAGGTGLSVAFDLPTLMGRDPDHPLSLGEVGKCGVNITSLADMETLFDGIALGDITTSMTINSPAAMIFAMYLVVAEQQGADWATLSGTIQNDILKEFIAQKEYIFPPRPSMRLITDVFAFCADGAALEHDFGERLSHPRSRCDRAAGAGVHAARRHRVRAVGRRRRARRRRLRAADLVLLQRPQRLSSRRSPSTARRANMWAIAMRDGFGATSERSWKLRFHSQTAGVSLTAQQPYNNVVRTRLQALSAVLGGTNSLHTELAGRSAGAADRKKAATLVRCGTQQVIATRNRCDDNVVDSASAGSYYRGKS
jgi:methylmalonyl-CoA mutase N-terminal domain/subunit